MHFSGEKACSLFFFFKSCSFLNSVAALLLRTYVQSWELERLWNSQEERKKELAPVEMVTTNFNLETNLYFFYLTSATKKHHLATLLLRLELLYLTSPPPPPPRARTKCSGCRGRLQARRRLARDCLDRSAVRRAARAGGGGGGGRWVGG